MGSTDRVDLSEFGGKAEVRFRSCQGQLLARSGHSTKRRHRLSAKLGSRERAPYRLIVKLWSMATCIARRFVVVDPELGVLLIRDARELVHRVQRHLAIGVETRNSPVVPVRLKMDGIAGQQHIACLVQMNEQRLVSSGAAGCRQDRQTAVAEQILVAIEEFSLVLRAERLLRRRHRGLPLVSLHDQGGVGKRVDIADMIGMDMRDRNVVNIARLYPDRGKFSDQRLAAVPGLPEWRALSRLRS